jgi:hypothetical protein
LKAFRPGDKADTGVLVRLRIIIDHALDSRVDTLNDCIKYTESVLTPGCTPITTSTVDTRCQAEFSFVAQRF